MSAELEICSLTKRFPSFVLGPLDLSLGAGISVLLGPSGAGKSTLIQLIAGLLASDAGQISLGGRAIEKLPPERRQVGLVFQDGALFPHLSVRDNIAYGARTPYAPIVELLDIEQLLARRVQGLSGGERRLVALARALVTQPQVLLLDEPFSSLDTPAKRRLAGRLRRTLVALDIPIIYVTHDHEEARRMADRLIILRQGQVVQSGAFPEVFAHPATAFVAEFVGIENVLSGRVRFVEAGLLHVEVGQVLVQIAGEARPGQGVALVLHPEEVTLHLERGAPSSARNLLAGVIRELLPSGRSTWLVQLDCGFELAAQVTERSRQELNLTVGKRVYAAFKATAPLVVPRD